MTDKERLEPAGFRLAFRSEGNSVNLYLANTDNMKGAQLIASINRPLIEARVDFWDRWKTLLTEMGQHFIANTLDIPVEDIAMPERPAPESERGGHG